MPKRILFVSGAGTANGTGTQDNPMDLKSAVYAGGKNSVIVLLNNDGPIRTEGVALHENQYLLGEGATANVFHEDGVTRESYTAPGSGGAKLHGISEFNAVVGTHPETRGPAVSGVQTSGGVNDEGIVAETRYHFLMSGQSNMAGWANASDFDERLQTVQENVQIWTGDQFKSLDPTGNSAPLDYGASPSRLWAGSELSLGENLTEALGQDVYLTKVTAGGTSINRWIQGDMLDRLLGNALEGSENIASQGYAPIIGGMAWNQGENDRNNADDYDQKLLLLLKRVHEETGISDLNLTASGVSPQQGGSIIEKEIIEATQLSDHVEYFSMQDFTEYSNGYNHFSAEAYSYMGYQFAVHFLDDLIGNPVETDNIYGFLPQRVIPVPPTATDDNKTVVIGLTDNQGCLLDNDEDYNINETLSISAINGNPALVDQWFTTSVGGRMMIDAAGNYFFDPGDDFADVKIGEKVDLEISYEVVDNRGLTDEADLFLTVYGSQGRQGGLYIEADSNNTHGTSGDDVIIGTDDNDNIVGNGGYDIIFDYGGNNTIHANNNSSSTSNSIVFTGDGNDRIFTTAGNDVIEAGNGNNSIYSLGGNDTITTGNGHDHIDTRNRNSSELNSSNVYVTSGNGNNTIYTGAGDDSIIVGDGHNSISASEGNDYIVAGNGNNRIDAGENRNEGGGTQSIKAGDGNNNVYTDASDDFISLGDGQNTVYSYNGNDEITTGKGDDYIYSRGGQWNNTEHAGDKTIDAGDGNNRIYTGAGDDSVSAGDDRNSIETGSGSDSIVVGNGNNHIDAGTDRNGGSGQTNSIQAGNGDNRVYTGASNDTISLGDGRNTVYSYDGNDEITTGKGDDYIYSRGGQWNNTEHAGDKIINAGDGNNRIYTGAGNDSISAGDDRNSIETGSGSDSIVVGDGNNHIDAGAGRNGGSGQTNSIQAGNGDNRVYTGASNDTISLGDGQNTVYSYDGKDEITTGKGDDYIYSRGGQWNNAEHAGDKTIDAGDGNNRIYTGAGNDLITAGDGRNLIESGGGNDTIMVGNGNNNINTGLTQNEGTGQKTHITAGNGANTIRTDNGDDNISLGNGDNVVRCYAGNDTIKTGDGDDQIYLAGQNRNIDSTSTNVVSSGAGNDLIYGSYGNDIIDAGKGDDIIRLRGEGNNVCIFRTGDGNDRIENFNVENDKIHFEIEGLTYDELKLLTNDHPDFSGSGTGISYGDSQISLDVRITELDENIFTFLSYV